MRIHATIQEFTFIEFCICYTNLHLFFLECSVDDGIFINPELSDLFYECLFGLIFPLSHFLSWHLDLIYRHVSS